MDEERQKPKRDKHTLKRLFSIKCEFPFQALSVSPLHFPVACSYLWLKPSLPGLPTASLVWDEINLDCQPGQCFAENLVYGPSTEYMSIPIAHDNRDCYQEGCRPLVFEMAAEVVCTLVVEQLLPPLHVLLKCCTSKDGI